MKKILFLTLAVLSTLFLFAEDNGKITEIGLTTTRPLYNSYNFTMKFGNERSVFRISSLSASEYTRNTDAVIINGNDTMSVRDYDLSASLAFAFGREVRKDLDQNFEFRYGMDFTFAYSSGIDDRDYDTTYSYTTMTKTWTPGLQLVLGLNYVLKDRIVFGVEFLPKLYYSYRQYNYERNYTDPARNDDLDTEYQYYWKFDLNTLALFSISYRF